VDLFTGRFSGHAFAPNAGWIALSNLFAHVRTDAVAPGADTDGDGMSDAWEFRHVGNLSQMTALSNQDADLATDLEEYLADTHPLVNGDELRITQFLPPTEFTPAILTWTTRPTRVYRIEQLAGFDPDGAWADEGSGWFPADPGGTTTRVLIEPPAAELYLRVGARPPLGP
jgi:hypothetical protein